MPAGRPDNAAGGSGAPNNGPQRTSFRPPWVKETPQPIPMPAAPWTLANRSKEMAQHANQAKTEVEQKGPPRKTSTVKIVPVQPAENGTVRDPHTFQIPKLKETPKVETKLQSREIKVPITVTTKAKEIPIQVHIDTTKRPPPVPVEPEVKEIPIVRRPSEPKKPEPKPEPKPTPKLELKKAEIKEIPIVKAPPAQEKAPTAQDIKKSVIEAANKNEPDIDKAIPEHRNAMVRQESMKKLSGQMGPAPPPMPPPPPAPPKPPTNEILSSKQQEKLDQLRSRPRRRPDWAAMMKEVESGKKLRKVQCNDRSQPLLPQNKAKGQFIYESEKPNLHNQLLKQIQSGKPLKHVKCNDRSKPILEGLRKFRRQMTIEEQIQKSQSIANMAEPEVEDEVDEMDDIDKIRDDLQSTKQMLALELRNKEAQIRENKRLQQKLLNLELELEKERSQVKTENTTVNHTADEKVIQDLKQELGKEKKNAEEIEKKYHETTDQLDAVKFNLEETRRQNQLLEKKIQQIMQDGGIKRQSVSERRESSVKTAVKEKEESESEPEPESESEEEEEEDNETKAQKRLEREVRLLGNKLRSYKNKEEAARRERKSLRDQMKKNQQAIKQEKKKYRELQREVNKMAALMRDEDEELDEEEEEEKEDKENEEENETEETETETESETSEEEESSESEAEDTPLEKKKETLQARSKRHENCLNALKKGNYMLKANVDRLQDDLNKQKEEVVTLQEDLDSVLADLG